MLAAGSGDLAAVRGHMRRDRRCLDRLFELGGGRLAALHRAATYDQTAVVAFLLAKGAAVDIRSSNGPGAQSRQPPQVVPPTPAVLRSHSAAFCSIPRPRGERQAAVGGEGLGGRQAQRRLGASADVATVLTTVFHRQ